MDIQRLAIETGEPFTLDEVREMIEAADENGLICCFSHTPSIFFSVIGLDFTKRLTGTYSVHIRFRCFRHTHKLHVHLILQDRILFPQGNVP